jgi:outer membrane protein
MIIVLGWINSYAQENLSLSDAIRIGLQNNYDLQVMRNNEKIADINNTWGNTSIMPTLNFTLSGRENLNLNSKEDYRTQTLSPDLKLNWVIFDGFSARINKQRFEELEKQSQGNTVVLIESTIQDIILAYNNCLLQQELVKVYKELSGLSEDRYNRTLDSKDLGAGTTYESLQAKTSWLEDRSNYLQQQVVFDNTMRTLNFVLAVEDNTHWNLTTKLETDMPDYDLENLSAKLLKNNNSIKNQYIYQSLLKKETALTKSAYSPTLSLSTGLSNSDLKNFYEGPTDNLHQNSSDIYAGLTLSWNIFNGGTRKRSVEIARINEESAQIQTTQMAHSLNNQLLQMHSSYIVQKNVLELALEKEATAKLNLELSAEKLKNGSINSFNYRDIQIGYMNAAVAMLQATYNVIRSNTDLLRVTGGIVTEYGEKSE